MPSVIWRLSTPTHISTPFIFYTVWTCDIQGTSAVMLRRFLLWSVIVWSSAGYLDVIWVVLAFYSGCHQVETFCLITLPSWTTPYIGLRNYIKFPCESPPRCMQWNYCGMESYTTKSLHVVLALNSRVFDVTEKWCFIY